MKLPKQLMNEGNLLVFSLILLRRLINSSQDFVKETRSLWSQGSGQKWFENYLYNRKQVVKYNGIPSEKMTIKSGVSQGSVLCPLLFLLYINDIQYCSELISIVLFAISNWILL